ncbi:MAG: hypothetical protein M1837_003609 [Sclerophora amabilis]|nr:MAG: hypothetical protein M1837_003609 [Sclerophora amabilis]
MTVSLPDDILHMVCLELWQQRDFNTLFTCAISSKQLAPPALASLYRMHNIAPVTNGGGDTTETAQQEQTVRKWASLWRAIISSSMGKSLYPYCHYIRALDLRDLRNLFEESRFKGKIEKEFFAAHLSRFNIEMDTPRKATGRAKAAKRLNIGSAIDAIGEVMTQEAPILEELSGDILPSALSRWVARLPRLQTLVLWRGTALSEGAETSIREHCPQFKRLTLYEWLGDEADRQLATFLHGIRPNTMEFFEIISHSDIGKECYSALNNHRESLKELRLSNLKTESLLALPMIKDCTSLEILYLEDFNGTQDLETRQNDVFLELVAWLQRCRKLQSITLRNFLSAAAILTPVLLDTNIHLQKIDVQRYKVPSDQLFHHALSHQQSLESVDLRADGDELLSEDLDVLIDALSKIPNLRDLQLIDISDSFRDEHISRLARNSPNLENLWTGGFLISDSVWQDLGKLHHLKSLYFSAVTKFTLDGLLEFVSMLGPGNQGLNLSLMNADPDSMLSEEEQSIVRETLRMRVDGRFDFVPLRDPDMSEFEGGDSD